MFSIIIPIRNAERYLKECLDSCVYQDYKNFEIIVVDNASSDGGPDMVKAYQERYPFIRYIRHEADRGLLQSRITGAKAAKGEYLINVDADDYLATPQALSIIEQAAKKTGADIIQYGVKTNGGWGGWFMPLSFTPLHGQEIGKAYFSEEGMRCSSLWSRALKRSFYLEAISVIPEDLNIVLTEDFLQTTLMMEQASLYVGLKDQLYFYRTHNEGYQQAWTMPKMAENFRTTGLIFNTLSLHLQAEHFSLFKNLIGRHMFHAMTTVKGSGQASAELYALGASYLSLFGEDRLIANMESSELTVCLSALKFFSFPPSPNRPFRKKVGIITSNMYFGGGERVYALLVTAFTAAGWEVVLFTEELPHPRDFYYPPSVKRVVLGSELKDSYARWQQHLRDNPVDAFIVHDHDDKQHLTLIHTLCLKLLGQKIVMHVHLEYFGLTRLGMISTQRQVTVMRQLFYPFADAVCLLVPYNVLYLQLMGIRQALFMPNPLTVEPSDISLGNRENMILWVGRFGGEKKPLAALEAFRKALPALPQGVQFCMLGDGYEKPAIVQYIQEHSLQSSVVLPGFIDPIPYYKRAKLHLLTSVTEAYPMALVEAKTCGVPTVMFALPYIYHAQTGGSVQVPQDDTDALAREIIRLFEDTNAADKLAEEALASIEKLKTEHLMERWDNLLRAVCAGDTIGSPPELGALDVPVREMTSYLTDVLQLSWDRALAGMPTLSHNQQAWLKIFHILKKTAHKFAPPFSLRRKLLKTGYKILKKIYHLLKKIYKTIKR